MTNCTDVRYAECIRTTFTDSKTSKERLDNHLHLSYSVNEVIGLILIILHK